MNYQEELNFARKIAREAGAIMTDGFLKRHDIDIKPDGSPLTKLDMTINEIVISHLSKKYPKDAITSEESNTTAASAGRIWLCDPIDGTIAYLWGVPTAMFSLALVEDGVPVVGVAYDPFLDRLFEATKGSGAFVDNSALQVSAEGMDYGTVAVTSDQKKIAKGVDYVKKLANSDTYIASFSGAVYKAMLVAQGMFVGSVAEEVGSHDLAAASLIVSEAGGRTTRLDGATLDFSDTFNGAILSNGVVHDELLALFHD